MECAVTKVTSNELLCEPPNTQPPRAKNDKTTYNNKPVPHLQVIKISLGKTPYNLDDEVAVGAAIA